MKKLILTSDGITSRKIRKEVLKLLDKPIEKNKALVMHTAKTKKQFYYVRKVKKQLVKLGIKMKNISYANISKKIKANKFKNFDIFYSCGGNTYYILDRMRKTGFNKFIKKFVKNGGLYIGVSAGSILAGKSIRIAGWGKEGDENKVGLKDLRGLNLIDIAIFPHYKDKLKQEIADLRKKISYPVQILKDKEALLILDRKVKNVKM